MNFFNPPKGVMAMSIALLLMFFSACNPASEKKNEAPEMTGMMTYSTTSEEALNAFNEGMDEFYLGNPQVARERFDAAMAADPNFVFATIYRGYMSRSAKEFSDHAGKALAIKDQGSEAEQMMVDIMQSYLKADMETRMNIAKKLATNYPNDPLAQIELVNVYTAKDMNEEAREALKKAVGNNPESAMLNMRLANSYMFIEPKDPAMAEKYAKQAVEAAPNRARTHIMLGDVYRSQNNLNDALASYQKASAIDPSNPIALSKQGHANTYLGNYDAARENFEMAMQYADNPMGMVSFIANTYLYAGDYEQALTTIEDAAATIPEAEIPDDQKRSQMSTCANNCSLIAYFYRDGESLEKYVAKRNELSTKDGVDIGTEESITINNAYNILWEARLAMVNDDFEAAAAKADEFRTMVSSFEDPSLMKNYHLTMGMIHMDQGNAEKAVEHLQKTDQFNVFHQYHLAKAYEMNGQDEEAMEVYNEWKNYNFNDVGYALTRSEIQEKTS